MAKSETKKVANKTPDAPPAPGAPDAPATPAAQKERKDKHAVARLDLSRGKRVVLREAIGAAKDTTKSAAERAATNVAIALTLSDAGEAEILDRADAADAAEELAAKAVAELEVVKAKLGKSRDRVEALEQQIEALKAKYESADQVAQREETAKRIATFEAVVASLQSYGERIEGLASMLMAQSTAASATTIAMRELGAKVDGIKVELPVDPTAGLQALSAELAAATAAITDRVGAGFGALPAAVAAALPAAPAPIDHTAAIEAVKSELGAELVAVRDRVVLAVGALETAAAADAGRAALTGAVADLAKQVEELAAVARGSATMSAAAVAILAQHVVKVEGVVADSTVRDVAGLAKAALG